MKRLGIFSIEASRWPGLSKLTEEAGEVLQVVGKLMGTRGQLKHWDGSRLNLRLVEELADLAAAIDFVLEHNARQLSRVAFENRRAEKLAVFNKWRADAA